MIAVESRIGRNCLACCIARVNPDSDRPLGVSVHAETSTAPGPRRSLIKIELQHTQCNLQESQSKVSSGAQEHVESEQDTLPGYEWSSRS